MSKKVNLSFEKLDVLEVILRRVQGHFVNLNHVAIIGVQHILPTSATMFEAIIRLGIPSENIFLLGKPYSTCPNPKEKIKKLGINLHEDACVKEIGEYSGILKKKADRLWNNFIDTNRKKQFEKIIILDDGGDCLRSVPIELLKRLNVIGIEQTTSGLHRQEHKAGFPIIEVAASAIKKTIEPYIIAGGILNRLKSKEKIENYDCVGVVGLGNIGKALSSALLSKCKKLFVFDIDENKTIEYAYRCKTIDELIYKSMYIFGCTGENIISSNNFLQNSVGEKTFMSCSSGDIEFHYILKLLSRTVHIKEKNLLNTIRWKHNKENLRINIIGGGYPINFSNGIEWEDAHDIQITRGMLFGALIQGLKIMNEETKTMEESIKLDAWLQRLIIREWKMTNSKVALKWKNNKNFEDIIWLDDNSEGVKLGTMERYFNA